MHGPLPYNSPFSPSASSYAPPNEIVPQWISTTGLIDLTAIPGFDVNSKNHTFEFVDWPEMVGIDNFNMPPKIPSHPVPEPGTLLLLGVGLLGLGCTRRKLS